MRGAPLSIPLDFLVGCGKVSMSKESEKLRERKIYNNHGLASLGDNVWCEYSPSPGGRMGIGHSSGWRVYAIGKSLSDAWYDHGAKNFIGKKSNREAMNSALQLCKKLTGQSEWVISPFGGYVSIVTAERVGFKTSKVVKV